APAVEGVVAAGRGRASHVDAGRRDLVFEVAAVYWSLATLRRTEAVLGEGLGAYDAHLEDARNRESFGLAARNEVLAVQVERDRAELDLLEVRRDVLVAEADLRRLLDLT